jgi:hypothetical protein
VVLLVASGRVILGAVLVWLIPAGNGLRAAVTSSR